MAQDIHHTDYTKQLLDLPAGALLPDKQFTL